MATLLPAINPKKYPRINGRRGRQEMLDILASGRSVLHNGEILTKPEHLPTEAELVAGDPGAEKAALSKLDAQIAALQAQRDYLNTPAADRPAITDLVIPSVSPDPAPAPAAVQGGEPDEAKRQAANAQRESLLASMHKAAADATASSEDKPPVSTDH